MKEDVRTAVKHEFEHAAPTVIHHPEEDMTILARWLHRGMEQGAKFWGLLAGVVVVTIAVSLLATGLSRGKASVGQAWTDLDAAQTPSQKEDVAEAFPASEVARVARLQAATDYFFTATRDLPNNRESALPQLKKALDLFQQVAKESPKDSPEALAASMGVARTHEARNELPEAIDAYKAVASGWPDRPEARKAEALAERLKTPEAVAFYKELYAYKPPTASLPPSVPGLPAGHPDLNGPAIPTSPLMNLPGMDLLKGGSSNPASSTTLPGTSLPPITAPAGPGPLDIAPPPMPDLSRPAANPAAPAQPAAPAPKQAETPKAGELPKDPFAPTAQPKS